MLLQYIINVKIIDLFYIFSYKFLIPDVYFTLKTHLNSDQPHSKCSIATCG